MNEWVPDYPGFTKHWKKELDCDKYRVNRDAVVRPAAAKKASPANVTKRRQKRRLRDELKRRMGMKSSAVKKAVLGMLANEAEDGGVSEDDMAEYEGKDLDEHEKDSFVRSDNSDLTEYTPEQSGEEDQYASDEESPEEEESDESRKTRKRKNQKVMTTVEAIQTSDHMMKCCCGCRNTRYI